MTEGASQYSEGFLLDVPDFKILLTPPTAHYVLYQILRFKRYIYLNESDVHIRLTRFDDESACIELIRKNDNRILEWAYIDANEC